MKLPDVYGAGQLFTYSGLDGVTDFESGLVLRSKPARIELETVWPERGCLIDFTDGQETVSGSDLLMAGGVRALLPDAHHLLIDGQVKISGIGPNYTLLEQSGRILLGVTKFFDPNWLKADFETLWQHKTDFFSAIDCFGITDPDLLRALGRAYSQLKGQIYSPEGRFTGKWTTPDRWPHRALWLWDSVFHSVALRFMAPDLALDSLRAIYAYQLFDGFIPHCSSPHFISDVTQPPLLATGLSGLTPSDEVIAEFYPRIAAGLEWNFRNRDRDGRGLLEWWISDDPNCRSGESGMDNSPRFDTATLLDVPDFNAFMSLECEYMAEFAGRLGRMDESQMWSQRHQKLNSLMNQWLWNPEEGIYMDRDITSGKWTEIAASSGFLPLICGAPDKEQAARLAMHLTDPESFKTTIRIPSLSKKHHAFYNKDMWRGPMWNNVNWLIVRGLKRYGFQELAREIIRETVSVQLKYYLQFGGFFEYYDDRDEMPPPALPRKGFNDPSGMTLHQAVHDLGWSAALFIDMVHQLTQEENE